MTPLEEAISYLKTHTNLSSEVIDNIAAHYRIDLDYLDAVRQELAELTQQPCNICWVVCGEIPDLQLVVAY